MPNRLHRLNSKPAVAGEESHQPAKNPSPLTPLGVLLDMPSPPRERYSPPLDHYASTRSVTFSKSPSVGSNRRGGRQMDRCFTTPSEWRHNSIRLAPALSLRDRRGSLPSSLVDGGGGVVLGIDEGGVCGVLHKWVNYGKGWKPRWFVLNDGVLSFYKLYGPNKISVRGDHDVGGKLIGQESFRRICSRKKSSNSSSTSRISKPSGEIHLKIANIRVSRSDDKKFSIFTGTRTVRLRAESREARNTWLDALYAVKDQFPRVSNSDTVLPQVNDLEVSTEKLRQRLLDDGVEEATIKDCEQIVRNEFSIMHQRLAALKQKELQLVDTLCGLEAEKVELENTVINEEQMLLRQRSSLGDNAKSHGGNSSDTDDNIKDHGFAEEEAEDDDDGFFDTKEFLSPSYSGSDRFEYQCSTFPSDEEDEEEMDDPSLSKDKHAPIERRTKLPDPIEKEKGVSLWSMIKDNIGKDLTKVCLPVYFNEPISSLQKCCEDLEYSILIDQAYEYGKAGNKLMRILYIAAFAVSGYASTDGRTCKPFNPLLGETYEADYPDKGIRFISEKVSHHPMVIAYHCEGRGWKLWGDCNLKNKFRGRSIQLDPIGTLTLEFDDGEVYQWSKVTTSIYNLILGKPYCDHYGTMNIQGNCKYSCKVKFKEQSIIDRTPHQVQGIVHDKNGNVVAKMFGKWNESLHYMEGDCSGKDSKGSQAQLLWKRSKPTRPPNRYNLTRFGITLNELTPGLEEVLPPTDSRLRPDQRRLENGEYEMAFSEKLRLEEKQRQAREVQEKGWKPKWFVKDDDNSTYRYNGGYWETREQGKWDSCPVIFW